jgi:hypothetical protein
MNSLFPSLSHVYHGNDSTKSGEKDSVFFDFILRLASKMSVLQLAADEVPEFVGEFGGDLGFRATALMAGFDRSLVGLDVLQAERAVAKVVGEFLLFLGRQVALRVVEQQFVDVLAAPHAEQALQIVNHGIHQV